MWTIKRTFHPVGQGAFYTEIHHFDGRRYNVVYDCGTSEPLDRMEGVVDSAIPSHEDVDILFISHFDEDHVSLLPRLRSHHRIKKIVLPFLHKDERLILYGLYCLRVETFRGGRQTLDLIRNLILRPESYFDGAECVFIDGLQELWLSEIPYWVYLPYNYNSARRWNRRSQKLDAWLKTKDKILEDMADSDFVIANAKALKKEVYGSGMTINENSMVVYSGPDAASASVCQCIHKSGCVYTGDCDLHLVDVKSIFSLYWNSVGTVQIPHHGAKRNFDDSFLKGNRLKCPISFGPAGSKFGHPSHEVIAAIALAGSLPIQVTDMRDSVFEERFYGRGLSCCLI